MNRIVLFFLLASVLWCQDTPERKVVEIRHLTGDRLIKASDLIDKFMKPGDASYYAGLNAMLLRGSPSTIAAAEALLRKLDVPGANPMRRPDTQTQFRIYLVEGVAGDAQSGGPIPAEIGSAVEQMKGNFQFHAYRLMDTIILQSRNSGAELSGILPMEATRSSEKTMYVVRIQSLDFGEEGKSVNLRNFQFSLRIPITMNGNTQFVDASVKTDLVLQQNQKLVVGKLSMDQTRNAVFLVITADL